MLRRVLADQKAHLALLDAVDWVRAETARLGVHWSTLVGRSSAEQMELLGLRETTNGDVKTGRLLSSLGSPSSLSPSLLSAAIQSMVRCAKAGKGRALESDGGR
jgi:hypothetical protein